MNFDYDVAVIGGAFSGAATALIIKRKHPAARVLIIEKAAEFDRKVGESTTEVSSAYMTRILGLANYLGHHQLVKQGLRMWFSNRADQSFDDCVEVGARYQSRLPAFQVDRSTLDSHMLETAVAAGCDLRRPAKVMRLELDGANGQTLGLTRDAGEETIRVRWVVDASGRAAVLGRKLGHFRQNTEHPINAVWARFSGVKDWDSYDWRERFPDYANACRTARSWATNHLMGNGWWCWIIPLKGGDVSAGLVYDSRIFKLAEGANISERLRAHLLSHPVGREVFRDAKVVEGDVHAFSALPYSNTQVCGDGWAMVGDAAGFIDPLYSPGLDFCSYTSYYVAEMLAAISRAKMSRRGSATTTSNTRHVSPLVRDALQGQILLHGRRGAHVRRVAAGCRLVLRGLVTPIYKNPEREFAHLPFEGTAGRVVAGMMKFYNRRLVALAKNRIAAGTFGKTTRLARALRWVRARCARAEDDPEGALPLVESRADEPALHRAATGGGCLRRDACRHDRSGVGATRKRPVILSRADGEGSRRLAREDPCGRPGAEVRAQSFRISRAVVRSFAVFAAQDDSCWTPRAKRERQRDSTISSRPFATDAVGLSRPCFHDRRFPIPTPLCRARRFLAPVSRLRVARYPVLSPADPDLGDDRFLLLLRRTGAPRGRQQSRDRPAGLLPVHESPARLSTLLNFAWTITESAHYKLNRKDFAYEIVGSEFLEQLAAAKGAIVLTAHMGSYDLGAALFAQKFNREIRWCARPSRTGKPSNTCGSPCRRPAKAQSRSTTTLAARCFRSICSMRFDKVRSSRFKAIA
jgi:flavin-dependent dehydrogenase